MHSFSAWDGNVLCFVEVRARRSAYQGDPALTIGWSKRRILVRAARAYLARTGYVGPVRFDVVSVTAHRGRLRVAVFAGAFDADGLVPF